MRLPIGAEGDIDGASPPCGEPQYANSLTLTKAGWEQSKNTFCYGEKPSVPLFMLHSMQKCRPLLITVIVLSVGFDLLSFITTQRALVGYTVLRLAEKDGDWWFLE